MGTDRFLDCLAFTLQEEGPPGREAGDPGGYTAFGRDQSSWGETLARLPVGIAKNLPRHVADLTEGQAALSYRWFEWELMRCADLPAGVDLVAFDSAVNPGPVWAPLALQRLVGVNPDGVIGPITLAAVTRRPVDTLVRELSAARRVYYRSRPAFWRFGDGWMARVDRCQVAALQAGGANGD